CIGKWHLGLGNGSINWNDEIKPGPNEVGFDYSFIIPATLDRVPCVFVENRRVAHLDPKDPIEVSYEKPFPGELTGKDHPELLKMQPSHGHDQAIVNGVSRIGYMKGGKSALWVDEDVVFTLTNKVTGFIDENTSTELGNDPAPQLYNLRDHSGERNNVVGEQPQRVETLTEFLNHVKRQTCTRERIRVIRIIVG